MSNNAHQPPNDTIEFGLTVKDFLKWKNDKCYKNIINNVIVSYEKTVHVGMISDTIAWNIANLTKPIDWSIPEQAISSSAKVKSVLWIKCFKAYVKAYMRQKWKSAYVRIFNQDQYRCLRTKDCSGALLNFKQICDMVKKIKNNEVRFFTCDVVCCFAASLNFNCRVCYFLLNHRRGSSNLQSYSTNIAFLLISSWRSTRLNTGMKRQAKMVVFIN